MKTFILTSPNFNGEVEFRYDDKGCLIKYLMNAEMSGPQLAYLLMHFPYFDHRLQELITGTEGKLTLVPDDLSFDKIWEKYNYKVGNKKRAEKLWNTLLDGEKQKVFMKIPAYERYLATRPKMEKLYLETYLSQHRWENQLPNI